MSIGLVPQQAAADAPTVDGQAAGDGPLTPGEERTLTITGRGNVPASGVDAVALNITAINPTTKSFLTVWPTGTTRPTASNLNFNTGSDRSLSSRRT